ncbi:MAG: terpene cyclase/mutase family protein [Victivallales bacterium]|nr:terpene cyclase/mutase family protein [Victivallales bacterium]
MADLNDTPQAENLQPQPQMDTAAALAAYQTRHMVESLIGPISSLVVHILLLGSLILFYHPENNQISRAIEVQTQEMEIKELDQKEQEELQKLEEIAQDLVPTVDKPELTSETNIDVANVADFSDAMASTDDNTDFSDVLDIRSNASPLKISNLYGGRSNEGRKAAVKKFGGSDATESAVLRALRWLKKTQNPDGSWAPSEKPAMCGLALLAYLAHGETPDSEEFGPTVQKAMQYLADRVNNPSAKPNGDLRDYRAGIVAYALSEAYGLTKIPFLKVPMETALGWVVEGQQKSGGFDYGYKKESRWDMSVAGWQYQAMKAGFVAGADVKGLERAIERGLSFMKNVSWNSGQQRFIYANTEKPYGSDGLQGAAILCLQLLGEGNDKRAKTALDKLCEKMKDEKLVVKWNPPDSMVGKGKIFSSRHEEAHQNLIYAWYYQTQAMFHAGQKTWNPWNKMFMPEFIRSQHIEDGGKTGYWDCPNMDPKTKQVKYDYDKWYTTTLAALSLQVYYRYLPTYKMPKTIQREEKTTMEKLDEDLGLDI